MKFFRGLFVGQKCSMPKSKTSNNLNTAQKNRNNIETFKNVK